MNVLDSKSFKFTDNELTTSSSKKLVNIAPAELTNRFVAALPEIAGVISNELSGKISDLREQLSSLNMYAHHNSAVIPDAFRGPSVVVADEGVNSHSSKFEF